MAQRLAKAPTEKAKEIVARNQAKPKKEKAKISSETRARYKKRKHIVRALENDNHSKIIAFATLGETGYWKLIGNSAIYYCYHEARRLKKAVRMRRDTDSYDKDKNGFVAIRDIDAFTKGLAKLGVELTEEIDDPTIRVYDTGVKFSDQDLKNMLQREELLVEQMNEMALPKVSDPEVYQKLRLMFEKVVNAHRTTEPALRGLTQEKILEPAFHAEGVYMLMARDDYDLEKAKKLITFDLEKIIVGVKILQNAKIWSLSQLWEIAELATSCKVLVGKMGDKGNGNAIKE